MLATAVVALVVAGTRAFFPETSGGFFPSWVAVVSLYFFFVVAASLTALVCMPADYSGEVPSTLAITATSTMSDALQPRDKSMHGLASP